MRNLYIWIDVILYIFLFNIFIPVLLKTNGPERKAKESDDTTAFHDLKRRKSNYHEVDEDTVINFSQSRSSTWRSEGKNDEWTYMMNTDKVSNYSY